MTTIDDAPIYCLLFSLPRLFITLSSPFLISCLLILLFTIIFLHYIMIDPDFFPSLTGPATTSSVAPIPTVLPGSEVFQELHDVGKRTLWYVLALSLDQPC